MLNELEILKINRYAVAMAARRELSRRFLFKFIRYTFPQYSVSGHNQLLCSYLDQWISGDITRLMIFMPPRSGKSECVSRRLPAYILGRDPDAQIIATSYSADLASAMNRDVQRIIDSVEYRELFPDTTLAGKYANETGYSRNSELFEVVGRKGAYKCAGVGGGITGRGFKYGIIDDPVKDRAEAESVAVRERIWGWYTSTFYTRQAPNARILLTMTRWHQDDLAGRLKRAMDQNDEYGDKWTILDFPAIAEKPDELKRKIGDALWPDWFPLKKLMSIRANIGSYDWEALYQQRPTPPGGAKIKRDWLDIIDRAPEGLIWFRYWDLAVKANEKNDHTASCQLAIGQDNNVYIRDMIRGQWEWPETRRNMIQTTKLEGVMIGIEEAGQQAGFISDIQSIPELAKYPIKAIRSDKDKLIRALPWIAKAEAGKVHLVKGSWINEFLYEAQLFTGAGDKNDDQIDAVSGTYRLAVENMNAIPKVTVPKCPVLSMPHKMTGF